MKIYLFKPNLCITATYSFFPRSNKLATNIQYVWLKTLIFIINSKTVTTFKWSTPVLLNLFRDKDAAVLVLTRVHFPAQQRELYSQRLPSECPGWIYSKWSYVRNKVVRLLLMLRAAVQPFWFDVTCWTRGRGARPDVSSRNPDQWGEKIPSSSQMQRYSSWQINMD